MYCTKYSITSNCTTEPENGPGAQTPNPEPELPPKYNPKDENLGTKNVRRSRSSSKQPLLCHLKVGAYRWEISCSTEGGSSQLSFGCILQKTNSFCHRSSLLDETACCESQHPFQIMRTLWTL